MAHQSRLRFAQRRFGGGRGRSGIAAVELALCLPMLLVLTFGAIEICNVIYVRTLMYSVAFEGTRLATRPTTSTKAAASDSDVTTRCTTLLSQLGVQGGQAQLQVQDYVTGQSKSLSAANPQDLVTVSLTAPLSQNSISSFVVGTSMTIRAQATLIVE
jgi:Flp pilus assembly protein TadG